MQSVSELCLLSNQTLVQLTRQVEDVVIHNLKQKVQNGLMTDVKIDDAASDKNIERFFFKLDPLDGSTRRESALGKTLAFNVSRRGQCTSPCFCDCHKRQHYRSPALVEQIFGSLFVGYLQTPIWYRKCNDKNCKGKSPSAASITYQFPSWFWHRAIRIGMIFASCDGPELLLRFPRLRPRGSEWFQLAKYGAVESMQKMLANGEASG